MNNQYLKVPKGLEDAPLATLQWIPVGQVHANNYNPNSVAKKEILLLQKSILKDGYCVEESTPILKSDLTWVPAGSLKQGDKLIAFDEEPTGNDGGRKLRRYRTSEVIANSVEPSELVEVVTDKGNLSCTPDHPFLTHVCYGKGHHTAKWVEAKDLKPEDHVVYLIDKAGEFWDGVSLASNIKGASRAVVKSCTQVQSGNIARLSTTTKTYIANGFAVHNTQPVVTVYSEEEDKYIIIDGYHRYTCMNINTTIRERYKGYLPCVVLQKNKAERVAATVRHNRARGTHSVDGMTSVVFTMLKEGQSEEVICNELGLEPEELGKLVHITGFSKLFEDVDYTRAWKSQTMIKEEQKYKAGDNDADS